MCGRLVDFALEATRHDPTTTGRVTRVDVLDMENSRAVNGVLVLPGTPPLRVEPPR